MKKLNVRDTRMPHYVQKIMTWKKFAAAILLVVVSIPVGKLLLYGVYSINHNFHEVVPQELYRSSSMLSSDLQKTIDDYNIKTVFDFRTHNSITDKRGILEGLSVYTAGARYIHFRMETLKALTPQQTLNLVELFSQAERPVLIHCSSGAERTSVAAAIWLLTQTSQSIKDAQQQLSLSYGYFKPWLWYKELRRGAPTINRIVEDYFHQDPQGQRSYVDWLKAQVASPPKSVEQ